MSIIDLLFNAGPEAKEILLTGGAVDEKPEPAVLTLSQPLITQPTVV
jgi:hypothetical protein